ncbi:probable peptidyl-prolyl cis-trans isomerase FKBP5 [Coccomyxa sp. Obi]|nr:probable peptidyl-prolyl cis-trans isomerase FKBP5 [Coccomyxa sp. Obi]
MSYVEQLSHVPDVPSFEPEIDDLDAEQDRKLRELDDLHSGAIRKGALPDSRPEGTASPQDGDLVYFHLTVRREDDRVVETTRLLEDGVEGTGVPKAFVLGKGLRAPRGWELALSDMRRGEKERFIMKPEYGYAAKDCRVPPPAGCSADAAFVFDIHLVNWYPKDEVRVASEDGDVFKRSLGEVDSWETPRAPFEVEVACTARVPSSSGRQGEGRTYFSAPPDQPLCFAIGDGQVPSGFEDAVCALAKLERAIVSCPAGKARRPEPGGLLPPPPDGTDRVEFELQLLSMIQVRDMTGTGEVTKRRVKEGTGEFPVDCPLEDCAVRVHYKASLVDGGKVVHNTRGPEGNAPPLEFNTGMDEVPEAVDMAVRLMTPGETSLVRASPRYAFDGRADRPEGCPEGAEVQFELELVDFDRQPNWHAMSADDKLARAHALKEQGNAIFRAGPGQYSRAVAKWTKALKVLDNAFDMDTDEQLAAASKDKVDCMTNLALVAQKERRFTDCFKWCDKALREVTDHPKALFRRATANAALMNYEAAREDFELCKRVNPSMAKDVDRELVLMERQRREADAKQKRSLQGFLTKS